MFGYRKRPQIRIGRSIFNNAFVVELAAMRRALQPGPKDLQFRPLMRAAHQQCRIFGFTESIDTNGVL